MFKKKILICTALVLLPVASWAGSADNQNHNDTPTINISTFDSGFGGYFTAKAIEKSAQELVKDYDVSVEISHFGDTGNAPYGEKTPEKIAELTTRGVLNALGSGADMTFIACNTASTQYAAVQKAVEKAYPGRSKDVISIIDASAEEVKEKLDAALAKADEAHFAILATPATIKSGVYPQALARLYNASLQSAPLTPVEQERWFKQSGATIQSYTGKALINLAEGKTIHIYQLAPANWVDLIEKEGDLKDKNQAVTRDLALLEKLLPEGAKLDVVGEFCTHYPVFDNMIQAHLQQNGKTAEQAAFIKQGPLMAEIFEGRMEEEYADHKRENPLQQNSQELQKLYDAAQPVIEVSGDNVGITKRLARAVFPEDPEPTVTQAQPESAGEIKKTALK